MEYYSPLTRVKDDFIVNNNIYPRIGRYQLLGDSIFVRLANNILHQPSKIIDGTATLGFCVSGQRIKQLGIKIKEKQYSLSKNVIILIGTNDVLVGKPLDKIIEDFQNLLLLLQLRDVKNIIILTLPPIPKLALTRWHWEVVRTFNKFLLKLNDPLRNIKVIDILPEFLKEDLPIFSLTISISSLSASKKAITPTASMKRRSLFGYVRDCETPYKIKTVPDPIATEKIGDNVSDFCRYLNKVNRIEREEELFNSEDEGEFRQFRPFIDNKFWKCIKTSLEIDEDTLSAINVHDVSTQNSSFHDSSSTSPKALDNAESKSPDVPDFHLYIMKYTSCFLRLDYYELFFYGNKRMDMVHPNNDGLRRIKNLIYDVL